VSLIILNWYSNLPAKKQASMQNLSILRYQNIPGNMMLRFSNLDTTLLNSLLFEANVYHDVELCEVSRFNGYSPNQFPFEFEKFPKSVDEKSQQNRFFTEVLDMILTNDFYEKT